MITAIELRNFKGIGDRVRIDLAPLTLLFGANNAGKSTILHALVYLHEILERGEVDVDRTELAGAVLDLGGFERLVHRHNDDSTISIRLEFDASGTLNVRERELADFPWPDLDDALSRLWVEVQVGRGASSSWSREPTVCGLSVGTADSWSPLIQIHLNPPQQGEVVFRTRRFVRIDLSHPLLVDAPETVERLKAMARLVDGDKITVFWDVRGAEVTTLPSAGELMTIHPDSFPDAEEDDDAASKAVSDLVNLVIPGALHHARAALQSLLYVGPLRAIPPRNIQHHRTGGEHQWSDGLAAWDALYWDDHLMVEVNTWLARLGTGIAVTSARYQSDDVVATTASESGIKYFKRLFVSGGASATHRLPCEVGVGLSQVIPVVVAALHGRQRGTVMIEQPELHIHPALQVALGDLFIEQCASRQFIIETHSEHLILRILRRIRETTANELPPGAPVFDPTRLSVLYVEPGEAGTQVQQLHVDETGEFTDRWPTGFFEERAEELF